MVAYGLIIATGVPSKMAMLYVLLVIPAVMGIVPVEEKMKTVFSFTRCWGLRWEVINYYISLKSLLVVSSNVMNENLFELLNIFIFNKVSQLYYSFLESSVF
jgi:hypothetical protein